MHVSKTFISVLITAMLSVLGAAAMAYVDVQVMKKELTMYEKTIAEINRQLGDMRKETNDGFREMRNLILSKEK